MTRHFDPASPEGTALVSSHHQTNSRHDGWTPARQAAFLRELAATHNVGAAARMVGMSRQSAYKLRTRLRGEPFDAAWDAAFRTRFDALAEAALDRALNGVEVRHYYNGELVGTSRKYDERLTLALLGMRGALTRPEPHDDHPGSAFASEDLDGLIHRVEHGPEEWYASAEDELYVRYGGDEGEDIEDAGCDQSDHGQDAEGAAPPTVALPSDSGKNYH